MVTALVLVIMVYVVLIYWRLEDIGKVLETIADILAEMKNRT